MTGCWLLSLLLLTTFLLLTSCAAQDQPRCSPFQYFEGEFDLQASQSLRAALKNLDILVEALATKEKAPSVSLGIVYDQELVHYVSTGFTDLKTKEKPTPSTIYRIGSVSKVWTVLLVHKFRDLGLISMDDPIAKLNSEFSINNPWGITTEEKAGKTITIQHLCSQVSGLPRQTPCRELACNVSTSDVLKRLANETMLHPTDVQPSYSNLAFALLGNVLSEYVGDDDFSQTLTKHIISPLGLKHTGLHLTPEQFPFAATGYDNDGNEVGYIDLGWEGPAGQLFSSVGDLASLLMQYFASYPSLFQRELDADYDFVLSPQMLREMLRPVFLNPDQSTGFGAPWEIFWRGGHMVRSKSGGVPGFRSEIAMIPELKLGVVVLVNSLFASADTIAWSALEILLPAFEAWTKEEEAENFHASSNTDFARVVGAYEVPGTVYGVSVHLDEVTGYPAIVAPNVFLERGLLVPTTASVDKEASSSSFVFQRTDDDPISCFTVTIVAIDGNVFEFVNEHEGKFQALRIDGMLYGMEMIRIADDIDRSTIRDKARQLQKSNVDASQWKSPVSIIPLNLAHSVGHSGVHDNNEKETGDGRQ